MQIGLFMSKNRGNSRWEEPAVQMSNSRLKEAFPYMGRTPFENIVFRWQPKKGKPNRINLLKLDGGQPGSSWGTTRATSPLAPERILISIHVYKPSKGRSMACSGDMVLKCLGQVGFEKLGSLAVGFTTKTQEWSGKICQSSLGPQAVPTFSQLCCFITDIDFQTHLWGFTCSCLAHCVFGRLMLERHPCQSSGV